MQSILLLLYVFLMYSITNRLNIVYSAQINNTEITVGRIVLAIKITSYALIYLCLFQTKLVDKQIYPLLYIKSSQHCLYFKLYL